jgi:hypothetical protein
VTLPHSKNTASEGTLIVTAGRSPQAYLAAAATIYSIDLANGRLTPHRIAPPGNAPRTIPAAWASGYQASTLDGKLIVSGGAFPRANGVARTGVYMINPSTWKATLINSAATDFVISGHKLITYSRAPFSEIIEHNTVQERGAGITIYNQNGTRLHHLPKLRLRVRPRPPEVS